MLRINNKTNEKNLKLEKSSFSSFIVEACSSETLQKLFSFNWFVGKYLNRRIFLQVRSYSAFYPSFDSLSEEKFILQERERGRRRELISNTSKYK